jgi:hypothetical protein
LAQLGERNSVPEAGVAGLWVAKTSSRPDHLGKIRWSRFKAY